MQCIEDCRGLDKDYDAALFVPTNLTCFCAKMEDLTGLDTKRYPNQCKGYYHVGSLTR